jgi:1-deoxy-D-xylulose-5-phosphate reductoisomerase
MKNIGILGSTGSIGTQAIEVIDKFQEYNIEYLSCFNNAKKIIQQAKKFKPKKICIIDSNLENEVATSLKNENIEILSGFDGLRELAKQKVDLMLNAIVGADGMEPSILALKNNIPLALANKESVVMAGWIIKDSIKNNNSILLPVDSEHSAIFQCLLGEESKHIQKIILTGSGGPFRTRDFDTFSDITLEQALKHPNWNMGNKITIDSATMMNKGLEFIEAYWLFDVNEDQIDIVVHPQSIIHSMVEFTDGSIKAQMGEPNMKTPIQFALSFPNRYLSQVESFNFFDNNNLTFEKPNLQKFPCIRIAKDALLSGGSHQVVLNVANDQAVFKFLNKEISFMDIPLLIENCINKHDIINKPTLDDINNLTLWTKDYIKKGALS